MRWFLQPVLALHFFDAAVDTDSIFEINMDTFSTYDKNSQAWVSRLDSRENWLHEHVEKPAMLSACGSLNGLRVAAIGCGSGHEFSLIRSLGGVPVVGVDPSASLLKYAAAFEPDCSFVNARIQDVTVFPTRFDFVYSSLAMHYCEEWSSPLSILRSQLPSGGRFVFSTHHPALWSAETSRDSGSQRYLGYCKSPDGSVAVFGDYAVPRWITDRWFDSMDVVYHHKPLWLMFEQIMRSGFTVKSIIEPFAKDDGSANGKIYSKIPSVMIFELVAP